MSFVIEAHKETPASVTLDSLQDSSIGYHSYYGTEDLMRKLHSNFSQITNLYRFVNITVSCNLMLVLLRTMIRSVVHQKTQMACG